MHCYETTDVPDRTDLTVGADGRKKGERNGVDCVAEQIRCSYDRETSQKVQTWGQRLARTEEKARGRLEQNNKQALWQITSYLYGYSHKDSAQGHSLMPVGSSRAFRTQLTCMNGMMHESLCLYGCNNKPVSLITASHTREEVWMRSSSLAHVIFSSTNSDRQKITEMVVRWEYKE